MDINFEWDGEKIKQKVSQEEKKHTPKEILEALSQVRNQITQMENQLTQFKQQKKQIDTNLDSAREHEKKLKEFEPKCIIIQKEKLLFYIDQISSECKVKAEKSAQETVAKDKNAYTDEQAENLKYLDYQKLLATDPKIADNIAREIITSDLYDVPVFKNPFKD